MTVAVYLYGVIRQGEGDTPGKDPDFLTRLKGSGIHGGDVELVPFDGLAALASHIPTEMAVPQPEELIAHQRVLALTMQDRSVLPFRFGMIARDADEASRMLAQFRSGFLAAFGRVEGREEVGLKAFWKKEAVRAEIERELGSINQLKERVGGEAQGRLLAIEVGQRVEACLERWKATHIRRIVQELRQYSVDVRLHEPLGLRMILNAAFLVERSRVWAFLEMARKVEAAYKDRLDLRFMTGLPPYSFTDLRLHPA